MILRHETLSVDRAAQIYRSNIRAAMGIRLDSRSTSVENPATKSDSVTFSRKALEKARLLGMTEGNELSQKQRAKQEQDEQISNSLTVLNLNTNASPKELRRAYLYLMSCYHPDKYAQFPVEFRELAEARSKQIIEAYTILRKRVL